jgi:hypothetical protein
MKGDFSRRTFDKKKNYSSVLMQQGRVQVDADWNEQQSIHQHLYETQTGDVIGQCGTPKTLKPEDNDGFKIEVTPDRSDLIISRGRFYVDGILCENHNNDVTLKKQYDLPLEEGGFAGFSMPGVYGRYLAYLDVWERHITAIDDPDIREKALGGPDTATRKKTVWQVKLVQVGTANECNTLGSDWKPDTSGSGMLNAQTVRTGTDEGPCVLPPTAGFSRLENQLYRVEIHRGTDPEDSSVKPTFKWSRDNGSVLTLVTDVSGQTLTVRDTGRDDVLGFDHDQWVEILDDRMENNDQRGHLVQIDTVNKDIREILIKAATPIPVLDENRHRKLRRWDQSGATATGNGIEITFNTWIPLECGIEIQFSSGTYHAGDYWLIPARTAISSETGSIEWPVNALTGISDPQPPHGIYHHYCPLALVDFDANGFKSVTNSDCRSQFPPLNDITASDVRFDNERCQLPDATTVQDALDSLCKWHWGGCTLVVTPGTGWENIFDRIGDGQHARICFQVGEYLLERPLTLKNKGNIMISGCGSGTRIIAPDAETVFRFEDCTSVVVQDLYAQSGITGSGQGGELMHLNGTLTFCACPKVTVERVELKCAAGMERAASCINVHDTVGYERAVPAKPVGPVRIRGCDLHVGHWQIGILLINVKRAYVEDNLIMVAKKPGSLSLPVMLQNKRYRSQVRKLMIYTPKLGEPENDDVLLANDVVGISAGKGYVWFKTHPSLVKAWEAWITQNTPKGVQNDRDLLSYLKKIANQVLINRGILDTGNLRFDGFEDWYKNIESENPAVGSQGIVVGGNIATGINILNNKIHGILQGIHIGVSHHSAASEGYDMSGTVQIRGNNIQVSLPPSAQECNGIFIGNCDSLIIDNNYAIIRRFFSTSRIPIDGIRVHGYLGKMMTVRQNHVVGTTVGIRIVPLGTLPDRPQWIAIDNVAPGASDAVLAPSIVRGRSDNFV